MRKGEDTEWKKGKEVREHGLVQTRKQAGKPVCTESIIAIIKCHRPTNICLPREISKRVNKSRRFEGQHGITSTYRWWRCTWSWNCHRLSGWSDKFSPLRCPRWATICRGNHTSSPWWDCFFKVDWTRESLLLSLSGSTSHPLSETILVVIVIKPQQAGHCA